MAAYGVTAQDNICTVVVELCVVTSISRDISNEIPARPVVLYIRHSLFCDYIESIVSRIQQSCHRARI